MWMLLLPLALAGGFSDPGWLSGEGPADGTDEGQAVHPNSGRGIAITNGSRANASDFPMTGALLMRGTLLGSEFSMFVCSSSLIAPDVVLLAAHCIDEASYTHNGGTLEIEELRWTRQADLTDWDSTHEDPEWPRDSVGVADMVRHEAYSGSQMTGGTAKNHDVALLFLDEAIDGIPQAYLPTEEDLRQIEEGATVWVVGWGQQEATEWGTPPEPGTSAIKMLGESMIDELGNNEMQVGQDDHASRKCRGDSGGPTFLEVDSDSDGGLRLIGVFSHPYVIGTDCAENGGVDTRVDAYLRWIDEAMVARCEDGTRVWCDEEGVLRPPEPGSDHWEDGVGDIVMTNACSTTARSGFGVLAGLLCALGLVGRRRRWPGEGAAGRPRIA